MGRTRRVYVIGCGMTKFEKPASRKNFDYPQMVKESVTNALADAKIQYSEVQQACIGYVSGDSTSGQRGLYEIGLTGIPMYNVNNNGATGSTALMLAKQFIENGNTDCVLAVGFEKMEPGSLSTKYQDREHPIEKHVETMSTMHDTTFTPITVQLFGNAGIEHMKKYDTKPEHFAKIAHKNHQHAIHNPNAQFQHGHTLEKIQKSPKIHEILTKLECSPTSDGSAACVLASEAFVRTHRLEGQAVEILALEMATDMPSTFNENSMLKVVGYDMTKRAAEKAFAKTNYKPQDVDVAEVHDCFAVNELITYEALGLCAPGKAGEMVDRRDNTYGGKHVINPSGGRMAMGHPLGATGLAQCSELCWQLRGEANKRQVPNARLALQHNIGLGGAAVVGLYRHGFPDRSATILNLTAAAAGDISGTGDGFRVTPYLAVLERAIEDDADNLVEKVRGVYGLKVTNGPDGMTGYWVINAGTGGRGKITYNGTEKPDVTFIVSDSDVMALLSGKLRAQRAFFMGHIKIQGDMGLAMKLMDLQALAGGKIDELRSKL